MRVNVVMDSVNSCHGIAKMLRLRGLLWAHYRVPTEDINCECNHKMYVYSRVFVSCQFCIFVFHYWSSLADTQQHIYAKTQQTYMIIGW